MGKHDRELNPIEKERRKEKQRLRDKASYQRSFRRKVVVDPEAMRKILAGLTKSFKARQLDHKGKLRMDVLTGVLEEYEQGKLKHLSAADMAHGEDSTSSDEADSHPLPRPVAPPPLAPVTGPAWAAVFMGVTPKETTCPARVPPPRQAPPPTKSTLPLFVPTSVRIRQMQQASVAPPSAPPPSIGPSWEDRVEGDGQPGGGRLLPIVTGPSRVFVDDEAIELAPDE